MRVVILAGGFGTRLGEYTQAIPKPMVTVGERPILWHLMNLYSSFGHKDFILALGYRADVIKKYFLEFYSINSDFKVNLSSGRVEYINPLTMDWSVSLVDTGINSMTGGRVKRVGNYLSKNEPFLLTYGDGLANIDINKLINFHKSHGKMVTVSSVRPNARFGEMLINEDGLVSSFKEKPNASQGWVNGGFFVIQPEFLDLIDGDDSVLEGRPLERAAEMGEMMAFKHEGFWQCMDTKRDRDLLQELWSSNKAPWLVP